ncbi:hypothetical protein [Methylorubrum extorquens]|uniref:hypothetical protein n=1 Tax=Methylorubrum extorquens TaxID=408 RepID=UPI001EE59689|nr:hypothetical protein [Methylorubrum extorquens]MCG5245303.1 hypothetical protein [Methylorubrum extorquens]
MLSHIVEAMLNQISGTKAGVAGVYNYVLYNPEKRAAWTYGPPTLRVSIQASSSPRRTPMHR